MKNAYTKQSDGTTLIHCWHGGKTVNAIIDTEDFEKLGGWSFMVSRELDVKGDRNGDYRQLKQLILQMPKGTKASHNNDNKLDCRKANLHAYSSNVHPTKLFPAMTAKNTPTKTHRIAKLLWLAREMTTEINLLEQDEK